MLMYNTFINNLSSVYGLNIKNLIPVRNGFMIITSKGKFLCRETYNKIDRILFVHGAKKHLFSNGFNNQDHYLCTYSGDPYIVIEGKCYIVSNIVEGKKCDFENTNDVKRASSLLARMHLASVGYIQDEGNYVVDELGRLPKIFSKRLKEIKRMEKIATKRKSNFDYMFLEYCNYYYEIGKEALEYILSPIYDRLVQETRVSRSICHNDLTYNNIILSDNDEALINFDYCSYELKVYDLANLIRRRMRKCNWDICEAKIITDEYRRVNELTAEDFYVMKIMLQFPQKFWRVANRYYNSSRSWAQRVLVDKLEEVIDEIEHHKKFLDEYELII